MMQTDVKAAHLNASGVVAAFRTRVKGFVCTTGTADGEVVVYDNPSAASGTVLMRFDIGFTASTPASRTTYNIYIPGEGILAQNGVYVDLLSTGASLTVFYG